MKIVTDGWPAYKPQKWKDAAGQQGCIEEETSRQGGCYYTPYDLKAAAKVRGVLAKVCSCARACKVAVDSLKYKRILT